MNCEIPLQLAGSKTYLSIFGPCLIVLLILVAIAVFGTNTNQKKLAILAAIIINIGVSGYFLYQARSSGITISTGKLRAHTGLASIDIPLNTIRWDSAIDASSIKFPLRKMGTSLPGMYTGWFKNENGRDAFLLRSDTPSTLIPTSNDYDLVVATSAYEQMKQCVRQ